MPLRYFICPNKTEIPIAQCLKECPNIERNNPKGRCMLEGHLHSAANSSRAFDGKPHVTQLLQGTRQSWLEITKDYAINPDNIGYALIGNWAHKRLEIINKKLSGLAELKVGEEISGTLDRLEPDPIHKGYYILADHKTWGGFAVAKALGLKEPDNGDAPTDTELQLNAYRIFLQANKELSKLFPISRLMVQATMRDSGLASTKSLGIPRKMPLIPIRILPDDDVLEYFADKWARLKQALDTNKIPEFCSFQERWSGRKCKSENGYCPVYYFCPEGAAVNKVKVRE